MITNYDRIVALEKEVKKLKCRIKFLETSQQDILIDELENKGVLLGVDALLVRMERNGLLMDELEESNDG